MTECPNCQCVWGFEEIQFQECWACGYPDYEDEDQDFEYDDDHEGLHDDV